MYMMRKVDYFVAGSNENAEYYAPGINGIGAADPYSGAMNYQDGSYIKMRNISLGYNFTPRQAQEHRPHLAQVCMCRHRTRSLSTESVTGWTPT